MPGGEGDVTVDDAADAVALIRLHDLVAVGRDIVERLIGELEDYSTSAVCAGGEVEASAERQRRIAGGIEELLDVAEIGHVLREALVRRDFRSVHVDARAVERAAADWLRSGIADARQLRVAARLLPAREGLLTLADALESAGEPWTSEATLRDILGAFRQLPAQLVDRIGDEATVDLDARLDELDPSAAASVIAALRHGAEHLRIDEGQS